MDFVHFVLDNVEVFLQSPLHHSPTLHDDPCCRPQTLYLAHHRCEGDGWSHQDSCTMCRSEFLVIVRRLTYYCKFPSKSCKWFVCRRKPPSLAASDANTLFRFTFNLKLFELLKDTTYDLYLFAVRSNRVCTRRFLPPEYPLIRITFGSDRPVRRRHLHCPGGDGSWQGTCTSIFSYPINAITTLVDFKEQLWCDFGLKPVFFPSDCREHQQTLLPWF